MRQSSLKTKMGKRIFLRNVEDTELFEALNLFFESKVDVPRIKVGKKQTLIL